MASTSLSMPLRHVLSRSTFRPIHAQRRWARVQDIRFLATQQAQSRILEKYRNKLDQKAKEEGHEDISALKEAYKEKITELRQKAAVPGATAPLTPPPSPSSSSSTNSPPQSPTSSPSPAASSTPSPPSSTASTPPPASPTTTTIPPGIKTLSSYLDLPKISTLPSSQIEPLWRLRHASSPSSLAFSLPTPTWSQIYATARRHPQFVLPLPREQPASQAPEGAAEGQTTNAAEIHYLQWTFPAEHAVTVLFTHLAEYKLRGEFASPHTTVTFHTELAQTKGLVLGQGTVVPDRGVTTDEGKWLLMCLQKFYGMQAEERVERKQLLESFTNGDEGFRIEMLLDEAERI